MSDEQQPGFWRRYRRYFLISFVLYLILMAALLLLGGGPQNQPFLYQIF